MKFSDLATVRKETVRQAQFQNYEIYLGFEHFDPGALRVNSFGSPLQVTSSKQRFDLGDTIYGKLRPYFRKVAYAKDFSGICSTDLWVFKPARGVDPRFVFYVAASKEFTDLANASSEGTRMPRASWSVVKNFEIRDIQINEQRAIVRILGALDDKIESNNRLVSIMEALGSAILDSKLEFNEFGFPQYEPDKRLGDVLEVLETGYRPKGGIEAGSLGAVSLGAESIQSAGVTSVSDFKCIPHSFAKDMNRGHLADLDVLVYKDGGKPGNFIPHVSAFGQGFPTKIATINEHVYRVRTGSGISQGLLYWYLRSPWMYEEMRKRGTGVAIPGLNSSNFKDLPLPILDSSTIEWLNLRLTPMLTLMLRCASHGKQMATLRDLILPELLSARIDISKLVEELS